MPLDFSALVYSHAYDTFARPVTFTPTIGLAFVGRGIYDKQSIDVMTEDSAMLSDSRTILDIREIEFGVLPVQGDILNIPAVGAIPALGTFEVIDVNANGGGETTLTIRRVMESKP